MLMMKLWRKNLIVFLSLAIFAAACAKEGPSAREETLAPDFKLESISGKVVSLSDFRGKSPVLIAFWATWCGYCRKEIPKINNLRNQYGAEELAILAVDLDEPKSKVAGYAERMGMNYDILLDADAKVADLYGISGVPTFFLVGKDGSALVYSHRITPEVLSIIADNV